MQNLLNIKEYQDAASRTCAEPSLEANAMYDSHATLARDVMTHMVQCQQADLSKRSIYYREPLAKLEKRAADAKAADDELFTTLNKTIEDNPSRQFTKEQLNLLHMALGWQSEAGEVYEALLKSFITGEPVDNVNINEEIGDNMWYTALGLNTTNSTFEETGTKNINKLAVRYPDKFTEFAAVNRNLEEERKVLAK